MKGVCESANAHSIVFVNLLALTSNNAFIIKFKMWLGGASHVVVETFSFFFCRWPFHFPLFSFHNIYFQREARFFEHCACCLLPIGGRSLSLGDTVAMTAWTKHCVLHSHSLACMHIQSFGCLSKTLQQVLGPNKGNGTL